MALDDKDPSGELTLVDYDKEYSGGHKEDIRSVRLSPAVGKNVRLIEVNSHIDTWPKGKNTRTEEKWEISVDDLISLIKAQGNHIK
ncbi:hypothetical protein [Chromobacterium haemolyticum]|uniref:hypothetical protein n=1 Tax=Chromobacterium haemolyticum TaxID=394935 RepID=UPI0024488AB7|nr:hypothetical protein [Chromobacterium haemolyticum]MDH0342070.1 hypothetical protein [Chromobacterium haemolyticum]